LLTEMTGNSLHMQWPLTYQSHGSVSQREQLVTLFVLIITLLPKLFRLQNRRHILLRSFRERAFLCGISFHSFFRLHFKSFRHSLDETTIQTRGRVTRCVCEKSGQRVAQAVFCQN
jgi:hypothetical protein